MFVAVVPLTTAALTSSKGGVEGFHYMSAPGKCTSLFVCVGTSFLEVHALWKRMRSVGES